MSSNEVIYLFLSSGMFQIELLQSEIVFISLNFISKHLLKNFLWNL